MTSSLSLHAGAGPGRRYRPATVGHSSSTTTYIHKQKSSNCAIIDPSSSDDPWCLNTPPVAGRRTFRQPGTSTRAHSSSWRPMLWSP